MSHSQIHRRAFTLIELLVVIAIIAVLASVLYTAMQNSRKKGWEAASVSNLKQWSSALNSSLRDRNGYMPSDGTKGGAGNAEADMEDKNAWFIILPPYIQQKPLTHAIYTEEKTIRPGKANVWVNPAIPSADGDKFVDPPKKNLFSYAMNTYLSCEGELTQPMTRIAHPESTVFMGEKGDDSPVLDPENIRAYFGPGKPLNDPQNSANFVFCDGHAEAVKRPIFDPKFTSQSGSKDPSPIDAKEINQHFTYIPYEGALP